MRTEAPWRADSVSGPATPFTICQARRLLNEAHGVERFRTETGVGLELVAGAVEQLLQFANLGTSVAEREPRGRERSAATENALRVPLPDLVVSDFEVHRIFSAETRAPEPAMTIEDRRDIASPC